MRAFLLLALLCCFNVYANEQKTKSFSDGIDECKQEYRMLSSEDKEQGRALTLDEIQLARQSNLFPSPAETLGPYIQKLSRMGINQESCRRIEQPLLDRRHLKAQKSFMQFSTTLLETAKTEVDSQLNRTQEVLKCLEEGEEIAKDLKKPLSQITREDIRNRKAKKTLSAECRYVLFTFVPDLQKKLELLRQSMAVMSAANSKNKELDGNIAHDAAFVDMMTSTDSPEFLKGIQTDLLFALTTDELKNANELKTKLSVDEIRGVYYHLISTNPVLLFMDDKVDLENLKKVYKNLESHSKKNRDTVLKDPPQSISQLLSVVRPALAKIPEGVERENACLILDALSENFIIETQRIPALMEISAIIAGMTVGAAPSALGVIGSLAFGAGAGTYGYQKNYEVYLQSMRLCESVSSGDTDIVKVVNESKDGLNQKLISICNLEGMPKSLETAKLRAMTSALGSGLGLGFGAAMGPLTNAGIKKLGPVVKKGADKVRSLIPKTN